MAAGSPFAGYWGDRWGRRPALIGCVALFGLATVATSFVHSVFALAVLRFVTGLGAGGAVPNATAFAAEFAPLRQRAVAVKLTIVCVPLGGMLGGLIAAQVLPALGWRALYQIGGALPLAFAAVLWTALPESPRFLAQRPQRWPALEQLLRRMSRAVPAGSSFEDQRESGSAGRAPIRELLGSRHLRDTVGLWLAFFFCLGAIYLVFGWLPAMLTSQGMDVASASRGLALYNFGGVLGVFIWAVLMTHLGSRRPLLSGALAAAGTALAILLVPVQSQGGRELMFAGLALNGLRVERSADVDVFAGGARISHRCARLWCRLCGRYRARGRHPQFHLRRRDHQRGSGRLLGNARRVDGLRVRRPRLGAQSLPCVGKGERRGGALRSRALIRLQARLDALLVEELLHPLRARIFGIAMQSLIELRI